MENNYTQNQVLNEYKKVVDSIYIVSETDLKGIITYVNDTFCNVSGYSREELMGKAHNIVRDSSVPKETFRDMWETIKSKKQWQGVMPNRKKNGEQYIVDATISPILNDNGEIIKYIAFRTDITKLLSKKQQELAMSVQKALVLHKDKVLDLFAMPTAIVDENSIVLQSNKIFDELMAELIEVDACLENHFIKKEGYISHDPIFDWKYAELAICSLISRKVLLEIHGMVTECLLHTKQLDEKQFIVNLSPIMEY